MQEKWICTSCGCKKKTYTTIDKLKGHQDKFQHVAYAHCVRQGPERENARYNVDFFDSDRQCVRTCQLSTSSHSSLTEAVRYCLLN
jgi:hypothetical protein